jgi:hypothetical protein
MQQGIEMHRISFIKSTEVSGKEVDLIGRVATHHHLVERLQCKTARTGTGGTGTGTA